MSDCRVPMPTYQRQPFVYIIGPVSGIEDDNRPAFERVREELKKANPIRIVSIPHDFIATGTEWGKAMRMSINRLTGSRTNVNTFEIGRAVFDSVAMLDGWEQSKGATLEKQIAEACGIPCKPWREFLNQTN